MVSLSVQRERAVRDPVGIASDKGAEVSRAGRLGQVSFDIVESQHDIIELVIFVGRHDGSHAAAEVRDFDLHAGRIAESVEVNLLPVDLTERLFLDSAAGLGGNHGC